jgi:hypothetical protein
MGRPVASEYNKQLGVAFAKAVGIAGCPLSHFAIRAGQAGDSVMTGWLDVLGRSPLPAMIPRRSSHDLGI